MISKRKYKEKLEYIELLKKRIRELEEINDDYVERIREDIKMKEEELLSKYKYAILCDGYRAKLWNDGRFEDGVRGLNFESNPGIIPDLEIRK